MRELYGFALKQGIGVASEPVVKEADSIERGQVIACCPEAKLGNVIHSSVSGVVKEITDTHILIEPEEEQSKEYVKLTSETPLERIREAGLIGLGGRDFLQQLN